MNFKEAFSQIQKANTNDSLRESSKVLDEFRKRCETEEDFIQLEQLSILYSYCNLFSDFLSAAEEKDKPSQHVAIAIMQDSKKLEEHNVSCYLYAYFMYVFLQALNVKTDKVEWVDPRKNDYQDISFSGNPKTFGTGAYHDNPENFVFHDKTLVKYLGNNSSITVPFGTVAIGDDVFADREAVQMVVCPETLMSIGKRAFKNCPHLMTVILPKSIREIGDSAFEECSSLARVVGGAALESIGQKAFKNTKIRFSGKTMLSLKTIGDNAFSGCTAISSLVLADSVDSIGKEAFEGCQGIVSVDLPFSGRTKKGKNRCVSSIFQNSPKDFSLKFPHLQKISIRHGKVGEEAFSGLNQVKEIFVTTDDGLIGPRAFSGCSSLENVQVMGKVSEFGESSFEGCKNLAKVEADFSGATVPPRCFFGCTSLLDWHFLSNINLVGPEAFSQDNLQAATFWDKLRKIDKNSFVGSTLPEKIILSSPSVRIAPSAFAGCSGLSELDFCSEQLTDSSGNVIPLSKVFEGEKTDERACLSGLHFAKVLSGKLAPKEFSSCVGLQKVIICGHQDEIPPSCFEECESLVAVSLDGKPATIGESAFSGCARLERIRFCKPDGKSAILKNSFSGCRALENLSFLLPITSIGEHAFEDCVSLIEVLLNDDVETIGAGAFSGCSNLIRISIPFLGEGTDAKDEKALFGYIFSRESKPGCKETLQKYSRENSQTSFLPDKLRNVTVTKGSISAGAFYNCDSLESVTLNGSGSVGPLAFRGCGGLRSVSLGMKMTALSANSFRLCPNLETVLVEPGNPSLAVFGGCVYTSDLSKLLFCPPKNQQTEIFSDSVREIGSFAICDCSRKEFAVKPTVEAIDQSAFVGGSLERLSLGGNTKVASEAFVDCSSLQEILFGQRLSLVSNGAFLFNGDIPQFRKVSISQIGDFDGRLSSLFSKKDDDKPEVRISSVFVDNGNVPSDFLEKITSVESVSIGDNTQKLLPHSLTGLNLAFLDIPQNTEMEKECFGNSDFKYLSIPFIPNYESLAFYFDNTEEIRSQLLEHLIVKTGLISRFCFLGFQNLKSVELLDEVSAIKDLAFSNSAVEKVSIPKNVSIIENKAFFQSAVSSISLDSENKAFSKHGAFLFSGQRLLYCEDKNISLVDLGKETEDIAPEAFSGCKKIESIELAQPVARPLSALFPDALLSIRKIVFGGEKIPQSFFANLPSLNKVECLNPISYIGDFAFANDESLETAPFTSTVSFLGDMAFYGCGSLKKLVFSSSLQKIGIAVFGKCVSLTSLQIPAISKYQGETTFGSLFDAVPDGDSFTQQGQQSDDAVPSYIPSGLTSVSVIGGSLTPFFFDGLRAELTLGTSFPKIPDGSFRHCNILSVDFSSTTEIGDEAFADSTISEASLPIVKSIGAGAFQDCSRLSKLSLGAEIERIGEEAFKDAPLSKIFVDENNPLFGVESDCLFDKKSGKLLLFAKYSALKSIVLSESFKEIPNNAFEHSCNIEEFSAAGLTSVGDGAFRGCMSLKKVSLPGTLQSLGEGAFAGCSSIKSFILPFMGTSPHEPKPIEYLFESGGSDAGSTTAKFSIEIQGGAIDEHTFAHSNEITEVILPKGISELPEGCFADCSNLISAKGIENIAVLGECCFKGCSSLTEIDFSKGKLPSIPRRAFFGCTALARVCLPESVKSFGQEAFFGCASIREFGFSDNVSAIGEGVLSGCHALKRLSLPFLGRTIDSPETIGFLLGTRGGTGLSTFSELTEISVSKGRIIANGFQGLSSLVSVTLPTDLESIDDETFDGCLALKAINLAYLPKLRRVGARAFRGCSSLAQAEIPAGVESIGDECFSGDRSFNEATIPDSVITIGRDIFAGCESITRLRTPFLGKNDQEPEGCSYFFSKEDATLGKACLREITIARGKSLAPSAFEDYRELVSATLPTGLEEVGDKAFFGCSSLSNVSLGVGTHRIGKEAFENCESLQRVDNTDSVKTLGEKAFGKCSSLSCILLLSLEELGTGAFEECQRLQSIVLPDAVKKIPFQCFSDCSSLSKVTLPNGVETIEGYSFAGCASLKEISIPDSVRLVNDFVFKSDRGIRVIIKSKDSAEGWGKRWNRHSALPLFSKVRVEYRQ
jgi:hypothetical protein